MSAAGRPMVVAAETLHKPLVDAGMLYDNTGEVPA
jgi:hypothetical protein